MIEVVTFGVFLHETEYCDIIIYVESIMVVLEIIRMIVLLSKYFFVVIVIFCRCLVSVNNIIYLVILGGVLLVVFVTSMLMGSLTNSLVPFLFPLTSMKGGSIFMIIIRVLTFL